MRLEVVVIMPDTSFTCAHSILMDHLRDLAVYDNSSVGVGPHLTIMLQIQTAFCKVGAGFNYIHLH
jgi:hypothetical protein